MKDKRKRRALLARRRRFRYRRFHALRLDVAAVVFLFVAGWLLCPSFKSAESAGATSGKTTSAIIEQSEVQANLLVLSPTVFAFTSTGGFADGVVDAGLVASTEELALLPPLPEQRKPETLLKDQLPCRWPGGTALWGLSMPAVPIKSGHGGTSQMGNRDTAVKTWVSEPDVVVPEGFAADLKSGRGKTLRVHVLFGAEGRAEEVVLGPNTLDLADAASLERSAMRLTGKPGLFAWITVAIP